MGDIAAFLMGAAGEYFRNKKLSYTSIFWITTLAMALLFLLSEIVPDIVSGVDFSKERVIRLFIATVGFGITTGAGMIAVLAIQRAYLRRKERGFKDSANGE